MCSALAANFGDAGNYFFLPALWPGPAYLKTSANNQHELHYLR